jgi:hypothetical protein
MLITRRDLLATAVTSLVLPIVPKFISPAFAGKCMGIDLNAPDEGGKRLGDTGYMHHRLHEFYPIYFDSIRCPCKQGECRPTMWQRDPQNPRVIQVLVDGYVKSATKDTDIRDNRHLPPGFPQELLCFPAHACAYGTHPHITVTCIWIMNTGV